MDTRTSQEIDKLAWIVIKDNKLLVARTRGNTTFYIPGGKREAGETDQQALIREISEELAVDIIPSSILYAGIFKAQAHGKPEGVMVKMSCYQAEYTGELTANSEIEEVIWVSYEEKVKCSLVTQIIMDGLYAQGLLTDSTPVDNSKLEAKAENKLPSYSWILFDADETLFSFDAFQGLQLMFSRYQQTFTKSDYDAYQLVNKALWVHYQNGEITAEELQCQRFNAWGEKLEISPKILNAAFLTAMADICSPLDGVIDLLESLKGKAKLGIITNGFTQLQQIRLERTGLKEHFEFLVVSEEVGIAKPKKGIFDHALKLMGNPEREQVLMVGDTLESDILGGINAGIHTCWLNAANKPLSNNIQPTYQIASLAELSILLKDKNLLANKTNAGSTLSLGKSSMWKTPAAIASTDASPSGLAPRL